MHHSSRLQILQLCHKFPYPLRDGGAIAVTYLAKAYAALGHEVTLLSMNTSKHWFDISTLPPDFDHYVAMHTVFVENHIRILPALHNLFFSNKSYHVDRFALRPFARFKRKSMSPIGASSPACSGYWTGKIIESDAEHSVSGQIQGRLNLPVSKIFV